jgi:hypothetical protein
MARTPVDTSIEQFTDASQESTALAEIRQENNQVAAADAVIMGSFDTIKAVGRIETAQFYATVAEKLIAETAINLREGKKYKGLPYQDENGNTRHVAHFDEFCQAFLGKSARRVQELMSNYNILGPNLYEQAERLGFRQRDYNALKALPADDRQIIAQAIEAEDLDKALDMMQTMAARHVREKEAAQKLLTEHQQSLEAKDRVISEKTAELNKKAEKLALLENAKRQEDSQPVSAEQRLVDARSHLQTVAADIKANVMTRLRKAVKALSELDSDHATFASGCLIEIGRELAILRDEYQLPANVSEDLMPEWLDDDALAHIEAMGHEG